MSVSLGVGVRDFVAFSGWSQHFARIGDVFLAHQNFEARAGPRKVLPQSSHGVRLNHCWDAGSFEGTLGQVRLRVASVRLDDDQLECCIGQSKCPDEREHSLRHALRQTFQWTDF